MIYYISFLLLCNKLPQLQWLQTTPYSCIGQKSGYGRLDSQSGSRKAEIKEWAGLRSHLELVLAPAILTESSSLLFLHPQS